MYFMGHAALGLALGLVLVVRRRGQGGRDVLGLTPGLVLLFVLLANLPDILHFGDLRPWTHNLFFGPLISLISALALRRVLRLDRVEIAAAILAGFAHTLGDMAVGSYFPLFPFDGTTFTAPIPWNSPVQMALEALLAGIALPVFVHPRLAGTWMRGGWTGGDRVIARFASGMVLILLAANLLTFLSDNFLGGMNRSWFAVLLFAEGVTMGIPFLGLVAFHPRPANAGPSPRPASRAP